MNEVKDIEQKRIKLILSYTNIFVLCFSVLYSLLLIWSYIDIKYINQEDITIFSPYLAIIIPVIFYISYLLNSKNKYFLSKLVLISTILIINFLTGIYWGFDLPSILLAYIFCIVILTLTSKSKENIVYISVLISSIFIGDFLRNHLQYKTTWHNTTSYTNDIVEFSIIFIFITFILTKFNHEQNKTLNRTIRAENILKKERDNLEKTVKEKTNEIKQIQMEEISKMYHLIEFGKLSSGLYHDLITPIQTMNLYIEKLSEDHIINDSKFSKIVINIKNTHDKLTLMLQNIRKQITLKIEDEKFNLITEIQDTINLVKNNYSKNYIDITFEYEKSLHILNTKKSILNHIILNLISNAYEACLQDKELNNKIQYYINIKVVKYNNKNYISITDNGIGIKKENLQKIFEDFYSSKKTLSTQNCGIGLSSSKYYTEKYLNGKILVESEPNEGTTMVITF